MCLNIIRQQLLLFVDPAIFEVLNKLTDELDISWWKFFVFAQIISTDNKLTFLDWEFWLYFLKFLSILSPDFFLDSG